LRFGEGGARQMNGIVIGPKGTTSSEFFAMNPAGRGATPQRCRRSSSPTPTTSASATRAIAIGNPFGPSTRTANGPGIVSGDRALGSRAPERLLDRRLRSRNRRRPINPGQLRRPAAQLGPARVNRRQPRRSSSAGAGRRQRRHRPSPVLVEQPCAEVVPRLLRNGTSIRPRLPRRADDPTRNHRRRRRRPSSSRASPPARPASRRATSIVGVRRRARRGIGRRRLARLVQQNKPGDKIKVEGRSGSGQRPRSFDG